MDIIIVLLIGVLSFILTLRILDEFVGCVHLDKAADELISNAEMSDLCKLENLSWLHENCIVQAECSVFFKKNYLNVADKIDKFITSSL